MRPLERAHRQRNQAEIHIACLQVHCAMLAHAIEAGDQQRAEFQLEQLRIGIVGYPALGERFEEAIHEPA